MLRIAGLVVMAAISLQAADFVAPLEGPVAFRRDKIPLDPETMADLSDQLATLAEGMNPENAVQYRGVAQILALSLALNPANAQARSLIEGFVKNKHRPGNDPVGAGEIRKRIWEIITWLDDPEAGPQGAVLGACLKDVLIVAGPEDPQAVALRGSNERGAWAGWIPPLSAYEPPVEVQPENPESSPPASKGPALASAKVTTTLWKKTDKSSSGGWMISSASLTMNAEKIMSVEGKKESPFKISVGGPGTTGAFSKLGGPLAKLLEKQHGDLPVNVRVTITGAELEEAALYPKSQPVTAALAVLASSAITGVEPDATIIGLVDETGSFILPDSFWDQLRVLGSGTGGRLVLPAAAAKYLPSMLAMENPRFFFDHEVILASNFQELLEVTKKTPSEALAKARASFMEVRLKATPQMLGPYLSNAFVRRRLGEITQAVPNHFSAKMLGVLGAGNRPLLIPRMVLVPEIRRAIDPVQEILKSPAGAYQPADFARIGPIYESSRTGVDQLVRYAEKEDRELLEHVQNMVASIRTLDRASRARVSAYDTSSPFASAYKELARLHAAVIDELNLASGEEPPSFIR